MKRDNLLFLDDILENIKLIENSTKNLSKEDFHKNRDIQDATIRRLEVIGEAVKNLSEEFKKKYSKIEWRKIAGTRDVVIHAYFGINLEIIWKVIKEDLFKLKNEIKKIMKKETKR